MLPGADMGFTDIDKAVMVLTTRLGDSSRRSFPPKMWHQLSQRLRDAGETPASLFHSLDVLEGPERERAQELMADATNVLLEADQLQDRGIWTLPITSADYPVRVRDRLRHNAPPTLFGAGERGLLNRGGLAVVGSRNVSPEGAEVAKAVAAEAVRTNKTIVSGAARGVDQLAMNAAYDSGGSVVEALADALTSRIRSSEVLRALDAGNTCLITQQHPNAGFSPGAAMGRNKLIYALADLTIVISSGLGTGGTWEGAKEALRHEYGRVAVWRGQGEGPGNHAIEELGAETITSPNQLVGMLSIESKEPPSQLSLLDETSPR